mmetsp:Transcript_20712/g.58097  ORF Transcript_20712/g.58097 Transcript_20712/m.58097 type:complete len:210 (+) Transcript_20712:965-1594(+)
MSGKDAASVEVTNSGTHCWHCARRRVRSCRGVDSSLETRRPRGPLPRALSSPAASLMPPAPPSPAGAGESIWSSSCSVLPPGAAHRSRTWWPADGARASAGSIATASCSTSSPQLCAWNNSSVTSFPPPVTPSPPSLASPPPAPWSCSCHPELLHARGASRPPKCSRSSPSGTEWCGEERLARTLSGSGSSKSASASAHSRSHTSLCAR